MVSKFFPYTRAFFVREGIERKSRVIVPTEASLALVRTLELFVLCTRLLLSSFGLPLPPFAMLQIRLLLPNDSWFYPRTHPPYYYIPSLFLPLSLSLVYSFTESTCRLRSLSSFSPSLFPSLSDHLSFAALLRFIPLPFLFHHTCLVISREPPLFHHQQSPKRDLTYPRSRTATPLLAFATDMSSRPKIASKTTRRRYELGEYR